MEDLWDASGKQAKTRIEMKHAQKNRNKENSAVYNVYHGHCARIGDLSCQKQLCVSQVGCNLGASKNSRFLYFYLYAYSDRKANTASVSDAKKASVNRINGTSLPKNIEHCITSQAFHS